MLSFRCSRTPLLQIAISLILESSSPPSTLQEFGRMILDSVKRSINYRKNGRNPLLDQRDRLKGCKLTEMNSSPSSEITLSSSPELFAINLSFQTLQDSANTLKIFTG